MDPQTIINIIQLLLVAVLGLVFINLYLVFRLKDIDPFANWKPNSINGGLFFAFYFVSMIAAIWSTAAWYDKMTLMQNPASEHGAVIDQMMHLTMWVSILVVVLTNFLLFYYSWKYRGKPGRKAYYYSHNNQLEIIWTAVPAVVMFGLITFGIVNWNEIMGDPPADAIEIEATGEQFKWTFRYPGPNMEFGETKAGFIDPATANELGFNMNDPKGHDDIVFSVPTDTLYFPVNTTVNLKIRSKDVLHSATLAHFRVKMDAVPGMPTNFHFKPTVTTEEMRRTTGNPKFNYEMSCQQICGGGHWNMKRVIKVVPQAEYQNWLASQKPFYDTWKTMAGVNAPAEPDDQMAEQEEDKAVDGSISMMQ